MNTQRTTVLSSIIVVFASAIFCLSSSITALDGFDFEAFAQAMAAAFAADEAAQQGTAPQGEVPTSQALPTKTPPSAFSLRQGPDASKKSTPQKDTDDNITDPRLLFIRPLPVPEAVKEGSPQPKKIKIPFPSKKRKAYYYYMERFISVLKLIEKKIIASEFNNSPFSRYFFDKQFELYKDAVNQCIIEKAYISSKKGYILVFLTEKFSFLRTEIVDCIDTLESFNKKLSEALIDEELHGDKDYLEELASDYDNDNADEDEDDSAQSKTKKPQKKSPPAHKQISSPLEKEFITIIKKIQSITEKLFNGTKCPEIEQLIKTKREQRELAEKTTASTVASRKGFASPVGSSGNSSYSHYTPGNYAYPQRPYGYYGSGSYGGYNSGYGGSYGNYGSNNYGGSGNYNYNQSAYNQYGAADEDNNAAKNTPLQGFNGNDSEEPKPITTLPKSISTNDSAQVLNCLEKIITSMTETNNDLRQTPSSDRAGTLFELLSSNYFSELEQLHKLMKDAQLKLTKEENKLLTESEDFKKLDLKKIPCTKAFFPLLLEAMTLRLTDDDDNSLSRGQAQAKLFAQNFALSTLSSRQDKKFIVESTNERARRVAEEFSKELSKLGTSATPEEYTSLTDAVKEACAKFLVAPKQLTDVLKQIEAKRKAAAAPPGGKP